MTDIIKYVFCLNNYLAKKVLLARKQKGELNGTEK